MDNTSHERGEVDYRKIFTARDYLKQYYPKLTPGKKQILRFHARMNKKLPIGGTMLEFGGGPCMFSLISAAARVDEIHFSEYLPDNLAEVKAWLDNRDDAFSWSLFIKEALISEGVEPTDDAIQAREQMLRKKITKLLHVDARVDQPLGSFTRQYDTVGVTFVLEAIGDSISEWRKILKRVVDLVAPGGYLHIISSTGGTYWELNKQRFPMVTLTLNDIILALNEEHVTIIHAEGLDNEFPPYGSNNYMGSTGAAMICGRREVST